MKKCIALVLVTLFVGACKTYDNDPRPPLMNTNAFSSFIPYNFETNTKTNEVENLDDDIEGIMNFETNTILVLGDYCII